MKKILLIILVVTSMFAISDLEPSKSFKANGNVSDMVIFDNKLFASTNAGIVDIFDINSTTLIESIKVPKIKDFSNQDIDAKVYSLDVFNNKILLCVQGKDGYSEVYLYQNKKLEKLVSVDDYLLVRKVKFVDDKRIIIATLSSTIILYNLETKANEYDEQLSFSSFSDIVMSEDRKKFIFTDESGQVLLVNSLTAKIQKDFQSKNLDKIFQIDYKNGVVLTAGQDRKAVIYTPTNTYSKDYHFLLYSCGLSPKGDIGAIAFNEKNEVVVFDVNNNKDLYLLKGQKSTLTKIVFIDEKNILTSSEDEKINLWNLK